MLVQCNFDNSAFVSTYLDILKALADGWHIDAFELGGFWGAILLISGLMLYLNRIDVFCHGGNSINEESRPKKRGKIM